MTFQLKVWALMKEARRFWIGAAAVFLFCAAAYHIPAYCDYRQAMALPAAEAADISVKRYRTGESVSIRSASQRRELLNMLAGNLDFQGRKLLPVAPVAPGDRVYSIIVYSSSKYSPEYGSLFYVSNADRNKCCVVSGGAIRVSGGRAVADFLDRNWDRFRRTGMRGADPQCTALSEILLLKIEGKKPSVSVS